MSPRFRNKLLTVCVTVLTSAALVGISMMLDAMAPKGTLGWMIKTIPLIAAIPAVLFGYEAVCDWYYQRFILRENRRPSTDGPYLVTITDITSRGVPESTHSTRKSVSRMSSANRRHSHAAPLPIPLGVREMKSTTAVTRKKWVGQ